MGYSKQREEQSLRLAFYFFHSSDSGAAPEHNITASQIWFCLALPVVANLSAEGMTSHNSKGEEQSLRLAFFFYFVILQSADSREKAAGFLFLFFQ